LSKKEKKDAPKKKQGGTVQENTDKEQEKTNEFDDFRFGNWGVKTTSTEIEAETGKRDLSAPGGFPRSRQSWASGTSNKRNNTIMPSGGIRTQKFSNLRGKRHGSRVVGGGGGVLDCVGAEAKNPTQS